MCHVIVFTKEVPILANIGDSFTKLDLSSSYILGKQVLVLWRYWRINTRNP